MCRAQEEKLRLVVSAETEQENPTVQSLNREHRVLCFRLHYRLFIWGTQGQDQDESKAGSGNNQEWMRT